MLHERIFEVTRDNIDLYLKAVAKEYRKISGKDFPAELILVGGASVLINYGFRNMTTDIDALILASSSMKDAINTVGDQFGLPNGWLNADFENTSSYSPRLVQYSDYYRTYSNIVTVRTVSAEYLIAMKLRSGRLYKNDLSDILGILSDHEKRGKPLSKSQIGKAFTELYGDWNSLSENSRIFIDRVMENGNYSELYHQISHEEREADVLLSEFEENYPGVAKLSNVNEIISILKNRHG